MRGLRWCAAALLATGFGAPASAQIALGPGAVVARVRDAAGRPLAGALVQVAGPAERSATTNAAGLATLVALPPGRYDVSVSLAGYAAWSTVLAVAPVAAAPQVVAPQLQVASFANSSASASVVVLPELGANIDPIAAHALTDAPATETIATGRGAALALDGTLPGESRIEVDGIPLAGGSDSPAAVRFRSLLGLSAIDIDASPFGAGPTPRDAIGGVVNYRTPAADGSSAVGADAGHDSAIGDFEHVRFVHAFGKLGLAFDGVTGDTQARSTSLHAEYAFSPGTSADFAIYTLQSTGDFGAGGSVANAPAFSAGVRTALGGGTLQARVFHSALDVSAPDDTVLGADETARANGLQLGYDLPLGDARLGVTFDRRSQAVALANEPIVTQTFTTLGAHGSVPLARGVKLDLADDYSGGTLLHDRHDPQAALELEPSGRLSFRLAAGSDFATAPDDVLASRNAASPALAPETAFGYRASANLRLPGSANVWATAYAERRFDLFAPKADGADRGVGVGIDRTPAHGFGGVAYLAFTHSDLYGGAQPAAHDDAALAALVPGGGGELAGVPYSKARVGLTYRVSPACEDRFGATFLGAGNALSSRAIALSEVSLCAPLFAAFDLRFGIENLLGVVPIDPALAALYPPHEITFSLGTR